MAGVSGARLRDQHRGVVLLLGLAGGELAGGLVIGLAAYLLGAILALITPAIVRLGLIVVIAVLLVIADLVGKTPQVPRQVPQRLAYENLSPGLVGTIWGFDLGLLVTTRKAASASWLVLVAAALLRPGAAPLVAAVMAVVSVSSIAVWSAVAWRPRVGTWRTAWWARQGAWLTSVRAISAVTMIAIAVRASIGGI